MKTELYIKSFGKLFRVVYVTGNVDDANEFMKNNYGCGVLAEENGLIFIADNEFTDDN